jgi:hypothetical protein
VAERLRVFRHAGFFCSWRQGTSITITQFQTIERGYQMGLILLVILVVLLMGGLPTWGYSRGWGYGPSGILGLLLVVLVVLLLMGYIPRGF